LEFVPVLFLSGGILQGGRERRGLVYFHLSLSSSFPQKKKGKKGDPATGFVGLRTPSRLAGREGKKPEKGAVSSHLIPRSGKSLSTKRGKKKRGHQLGRYPIWDFQRVVVKWGGKRKARNSWLIPTPRAGRKKKKKKRRKGNPCPFKIENRKKEQERVRFRPTRQQGKGGKKKRKRKREGSSATAYSLTPP